MKKILIAFAVAAFLALLVHVASGQTVPPWKPKPTPTIVSLVDVNGPFFRVDFAAGAVSSCTIFKQVTRGNGDIPYEPRKCWILDDTTTSYSDNWEYIREYDADWEIWAEVTYLKQGSTTEVDAIKSNVVKAHR